MGPPRANPRSTGSNPARIIVVARDQPVTAVDDNGYLAELLQKRQIEAGVEYPLLQGGSCEYTHFAKAIRDALCSVADEQVILYDGAGGTLLQSLVETAKAGDLEIANISLTCGFFLKEQAAGDIVPDAKQPCAGFWSVVSTDSAEKQIVCPPAPAGTAVRYEVVNTALHHLMGTVTIRFRWPGEDLYVQLQVKSAANYAAFLGLAQPRTTLLNVQIGELTQQGTFMPRIMVSNWPNAKLAVTDLNPLFNPAKWPSPPLPVDATAAAPEVDEEDYVAGRYWAEIAPFGLMTLRGKKPKQLCKFHITAISKKAVRKASGAGETDSTTFWLKCKEQDGTETEVPVNFDSLRGFSTASAFDRVNARLLCTQHMKEGVLRDIIFQLDENGDVPIVTAPSVFGLQPCGDFLFSNCVLPADDTPAVRSASACLSSSTSPTWSASRSDAPASSSPSSLPALSANASASSSASSSASASCSLASSCSCSLPPSSDAWSSSVSSGGSGSGSTRVCQKSIMLKHERHVVGIATILRPTVFSNEHFMNSQRIL